MVASVSGSPTAEEVAAVVAAIETMWPRAVAVAPQRSDGPPVWRLSGRWWADPLVRRRPRP